VTRQQTPARDSAASAGSHDLGSLVGRAGAALNLQCRAAHQELTQTQLLLANATRKLLDSFHAASHALAGLSTEVEDAANRVGENLLAASQHLQFSDLVGQLLATTEQRVDRLALVSQRLQELIHAMDARRPDAQAGEAHVTGETRAFLEAVAALESCGDSRVKQRDTRAGNVELF